jgi:hypothetical protein
MTRWMLTGALCTTALALATTAAAQDTERTFHETFDVREGMRLRLVHGDGDVEIQPWDRNELDVEVYYRAEEGILGLGEPEDFTVAFDENGDRISVTGRPSGTGGDRFGFFQPRVLEYAYTIRAPAYLELELRGDDGDVDLSGWNGELDVELDDGDLSLRDVTSSRISVELEDGDLEARGIQGDLLVRVDDGDVSITGCDIGYGSLRLEDGELDMEDCRGNLSIVVDDGSVRLESLIAGDLDVRSEDGDIYVELLGGPPPSVDLETEDGRVDIEIETDVSAEFSIVTDDGSINLDLPGAEDIEKRRHSASGSMGGGEGRIRVRTADGRVVMREIRPR